MDQDNPLRDDLERLHDELERTRTLDPQSRQMLVHLERDIQALLKTPTPAARSSLQGRLGAALARVEDSNPGLTLVIKQVLDHLAEA